MHLAFVFDSSVAVSVVFNLDMEDTSPYLHPPFLCLNSRPTLLTIKVALAFGGKVGPTTHRDLLLFMASDLVGEKEKRKERKAAWHSAVESKHD